MAAERQDLVSICQLLAIPSDDKPGEKSNIDLLKAILRRLDEDDGIFRDRIPDSLAFPQRVRDSVKLQDRWEQWEQLKRLDEVMRQDFACRRQMMLNRLDCTVESFKWKSSGEKAEGQSSTNDRIHQAYDQGRRELRPEPQVRMAHLLAARDTDTDRLLNGVVSSRKLDCQVNYKQADSKRNSTSELVNLKQVIIPQVPDRGGRTEEIHAPAKESFSHQNRRQFNHRKR